MNIEVLRSLERCVESKKWGYGVYSNTHLFFNYRIIRVYSVAVM